MTSGPIGRMETEGHPLGLADEEGLEEQLDEERQAAEWASAQLAKRRASRPGLFTK